MKKKSKRGYFPPLADQKHEPVSRRPKSFYDLIRENCYVPSTAPVPQSTCTAEQSSFIQLMGEGEEDRGELEDKALLQQHDWLDEDSRSPLVPWNNLRSLAAATKKNITARNTLIDTGPSSESRSSNLSLYSSDSSQLDSEEEAALADYIQNIGPDDLGFCFSGPLQSLILSDWEDTSEEEEGSVETEDAGHKEKGRYGSSSADTKASDDDDDFELLVQEYQKTVARQKDGTYYQSSSFEGLIESAPNRGLKARIKAMKKEKQRQQHASLRWEKYMPADWANSPSAAKTNNRYPKIEFRELNRQIKRFIQDDSLQEYALDPMNPFLRKKVHELSCLYGLKSKSRGNGDQRFIVLYKTKRSAQPGKSGRAAIDRLIDRGNALQNTACYQRDLAIMDSKKGKKKAKSKPGGRSSIGSSSSGPYVRPGMIVGSSASPIQESNVGNVLLRKMGWMPGSTLGSLGSSDGLLDPLTVTIRRKNAGLGLND